MRKGMMSDIIKKHAGRHRKHAMHWNSYVNMRKYSNSTQLAYDLFQTPMTRNVHSHWTLPLVWDRTQLLVLNLHL